MSRRNHGSLAKGLRDVVMRNQFINLTEDTDLLTYVKTGLIAPSLGSSMPMLTDGEHADKKSK